MSKAKSEKEFEVKTMPAWTKSVDGRTVVGITAVTGNVDEDGDRIIAGAFAKTIADNARRFRHLWQHGADGWDYGVTPPIAAIKSIQEIGRDALPASVLVIAPMATGGLEVSREYLKTERGNEILAAYEAGIELEMSIGYATILKKYVEDNERVSMSHWRDLIEIKLFDTSDVNWGMNSAAVGSSKNLERRMALVVERMKSLREEFDEGVTTPLVKEFRALCAEFAIDAKAVTESRAEPTIEPVRISLTPSLKRLRDLELALVS